MREDDLDRGRGGAPADGGVSDDGRRRGRRQLSPEERRLRARVAAHTMHARNDGRRVTEHARRAFLDRFERDVDPDGVLPEEERRRRADHARRAHMLRLALWSAQARRANRRDRSS